MKILEWVATIVISIITILGIVFIALFIYYYPVLDRLYFNTCSHYPEAFIDCKEK